MKIIVAVDELNGILFNKRRQSQDIKLRNYISQLTTGSFLFMNSYSAKQFKEHTESIIIVDDDFLNKASESDFCFVEDEILAPYLNKTSTIFLCKWNRVYPSDMQLDIDLTVGWELNSFVDIVGKSHKQITIEEWKKI